MSFNQREVQARLLLCRAASSFQLQQAYALAALLSNSRPKLCKGLGATNARLLPAWGHVVAEVSLKWRVRKTPKLQESCQKVRCTVPPISQASEVGQEGKTTSFKASQRKKTIPKPWRSLNTTISCNYPTFSKGYQESRVIHQRTTFPFSALNKGQ